MPKKSHNQWKVCRFKSRLGEKEGWCFWVFEWSGTRVHTLKYIVLYTTLIGKPLPLLTSGISTTLSRTFLVLFLLKQHDYVQCYTTLSYKEHWVLIAIFLQVSLICWKWAISLRCVIIVRSWVFKDFAMPGIFVTHKLTDLEFLCLSYR